MSASSLTRTEVRAARLLVATAVILTGTVFLPSALDPINVPKLTCLLLATIAVAAAVVSNAVRNRTVDVASGLPALVAVLLLAAFGLAAIVAPYSTPAVLGVPGRNSGLLAYGSAVILYWLTLTIFTPSSAAILAVSLEVSGLLTASYGLLQRLGIDTIAWSNPFNPIIASLGNPDFASGYLGIAVPVCAWGALWTGWSRPLRIGSGAVGVLCFLVAVLSQAVQGPMAAAAGLAVFAVALLLNAEDPKRRQGLVGLGALGAVGIAVIAAGFAGVGPARSFFSGVSFDARACYWRGAVTMWRRSPITGIGLDSFGEYWRRDQPLYCPRLLGPENYSDAAHSVPLQYLAQGGIILVAAYALFTAVVVLSIVRGLTRLSGQPRLLLGGLAGSWLAYRVQSSVSIDQVPLLLLDYLLGAAVIVTAGNARVRRVRLPGAPPETPVRRRGRQAGPELRRLNVLDAWMLGGITVISLVLIWLAVMPLRASRAARQGDVALAFGHGDAAVAAYTKAIRLEPGVGVYRTRLGQLYQRSGQAAKAVPIYQQAFRIDGQEVGALRNAAALAEKGNNVPLARRLFTAAVAAEPKNSRTIQEFAQFEMRHGGAKVASRRMERAVRDFPDDADLWAVLGLARNAVGDVPSARAAWLRAVSIDPTQPTAVGWLEITKGK